MKKGYGQNTHPNHVLKTIVLFGKNTHVLEQIN